MDFFCPTSGLTVYTRPEWINQEVSKTFTANFYILGGVILYSRPAGKADLEGVQNSLALNDEVEKYVGDGVGNYIQIEDYAGLNGSSQSARDYFVDKMNTSSRRAPLIFCNLAGPLTIAVKIGSRFITTGKDILVDRRYGDAIKRALKLCEAQGVEPEFNFLGRDFCFDSPDRSLKPMQIMADEAWQVRLPGFYNRSVILDQNILYSVTEGYLDAEHMPYVDKARSMCQASLPPGATIDYFVINSSNLKGGSRTGRAQYMQSLKNWHQQFPFRLYVLYGVNTFMRTAALLGKVLLPFEVKVAQDASHAFELITRDRLGGVAATQKKSEPATALEPSQEDIEKLLALIGSINWEQEGLDIDVEMDEQHPFYVLFQSIKLIKEELDSLFAERKRAAEILHDSNAQLQSALAELKQTQEKMVQQERLAAVGQLAAGIAHDFNNILTGIMGFAELMQMSAATPSAMRPNLQRIVAASQQAAHLVHQLLDFSRKSIRHAKQFSLDSFTVESVKFFEHTIPENIQISLKVDPGDYLLEADPAQMQQVLTNLAVNARDAMPSGGKLDISLSPAAMTSDDLCTTCGESLQGDWLVLAVTDNGSGIPADVLPHIFEPFYTTKAVDKGTGLGLAQVYGIVRQHAGHIVVESRVNRGTTITIYLPPVAKQTRAKTEDPPPWIIIGHGELILLVEDEPVVLETGKEMLEYLNYKVISASNGREALAIYQERRADIALVLSDMVMPDMSGDELYLALKVENPALKMVMMSGYPLQEKGAELLEQGVIDWFEKPLDFKRFAQGVGRAISDGKGRWRA